mmetsp:Transcript_12660/g.33421  ORF Transcript_12660/g.33421 Transcript_12660/m.33421 type:complete len:252 (-) Transcript_12660:391-1146(-)
MSGAPASKPPPPPMPPIPPMPPGIPGIPPMPPPNLPIIFWSTGPTSGSCMYCIIFAGFGAPPAIISWKAAMTFGFDMAAMTSGSFIMPCAMPAMPGGTPPIPGMPPIPPGIPPPLGGGALRACASCARRWRSAAAFFLAANSAARSFSRCLALVSAAWALTSAHNDARFGSKSIDWALLRSKFASTNSPSAARTLPRVLSARHESGFSFKAASQSLIAAAGRSSFKRTSARFASVVAERHAVAASACKASV